MSKIIKFRVRFTDNLKKNEFEVMKSLNSITPLNIQDAFVGSDFAIITLSCHNELERLLTPEATAKLDEMHLKIIPPPSHKSEKSLFLPRVPHFIANSDMDELAIQINSCNKNKVKATEVVVVTGPNFVHGMRKNLKVTFETLEQTNFAFENGFNIGDFKIDANNIRREDFVEIRQCFRCFAYDHFSNKCAKTPICSICSQTHSFKTCPNKEHPKCANCQGPHWAIASACPIRKNEVKKIKTSRNSPNPNPTQNPSPQNPGPSNPTPQTPAPPPANPTTPSPLPQPLNPAQFPSLPSKNPQPPSIPQPQPQPLPNQTPPPAQTPLQTTHNNFDVLPLYVEIWKSIAEKIAGNNILQYINVLTAYLQENSFPSFKTPSSVIELINSKQETPSIPTPTSPIITSTPKAPHTLASNPPTLPAPNLIIPSPSSPAKSSLQEIIEQTLVTIKSPPHNRTVIHNIPKSHNSSLSDNSQNQIQESAPSSSEYSSDSDKEINISQTSSSSANSSLNLNLNIATPPAPSSNPSSNPCTQTPSASAIITEVANATDRSSRSRSRKKRNNSGSQPRTAQSTNKTKNK